MSGLVEFQEVAMSKSKTLIPVLTIEEALKKFVSMTSVIYAAKHEGCEYTVNWEDTLSELEEFAQNGYARADQISARAADVVQAVRDRAVYMQNRRWEFDGLTTIGEAAEHLALFALCKTEIASINADTQALIRVAITTEEISAIVSNHFDNDFVGGDHLLEALLAAGMPLEGEETVIDVRALLVDESRSLDRIIGLARKWTRDPQWIADTAIYTACQLVLKEIGKGALNGK